MLFSLPEMVSDKKIREYWGQSPCANDAKTLEEVKS